MRRPDASSPSAVALIQCVVNSTTSRGSPALAQEGAFVLTDIGIRIREKRTGRVTGEERLERARANSEVQRRKEFAAFVARQSGADRGRK